jgi:hypothetical protein
VPQPVRLENVHVIGADPGGTTGLARLYQGTLTTCAVRFAEVSSTLEDWLTQQPDAVIGCERFVVTQRTARLTSQPEAIRLTGVIHAIVEQYPPAVVLDQNMSDAKRLVNAALRKMLGWQQTGRHATHRNDAVCQLGKAMVKAYPRVFYEMISPHVS